jgi:glycosyltransferase involved in cell wall biosynthesis
MVKQPLKIPEKTEKYILYLGAVNEGRGFEVLIPAMAYVECKLIICDHGNFFEQAKQLVINFNLSNKVVFKGMMYWIHFMLKNIKSLMIMLWPKKWCI